MYVLTTPVLTNEYPPKSVSEEFFGYNPEYGGEVIAEYDDPETELPSQESWYEEHATFWKEIGRANIDVPYDPQQILELGGIRQYLCDGRLSEEEYPIGASTAHNVAACIGEMAYDAGITPIELVNTVNAALRERNMAILRASLPLIVTTKKVGDNSYEHVLGRRTNGITNKPHPNLL